METHNLSKWLCSKQKLSSSAVPIRHEALLHDFYSVPIVIKSLNPHFLSELIHKND